MPTSSDRARLLEAYPPTGRVRATSAGPLVHFSVPSTDDVPDQHVWWRVSDAELARLVQRLAPGARSAYGRGSDGFAVLITALDEALGMFEGERGQVVVSADLSVRIEPR